MLADRLNAVAPSPTMAMTERASALKAEGRDIITLSAGEPDFDTPPAIVEAAKQALDQGVTRYTPAPGLMALRRAVAAQNERVRGVPTAPEQVIVSVGAKHALFEFFQAVLNPGDEVVIPRPYWVSYPDQVRLAGGVPVFAETTEEEGFTLTLAGFSRVKTDKTKVLVINTPNNPSGAVYGAGRLCALAEAAAREGIWCLSDEVYRELIYGDRAHGSPVSLVSDEMRPHAFVVDGVSKTYAMTGWRIGWGIGHPDVIKGMAKIQSQSTSNPTAVSQAAAIAALTSFSPFLDAWRRAYRERRDAICRGLRKIPGVTCQVPEGAFYVLPSMRGVLARMGRDATDITLAQYLLEEAGVATVPGSAFGAPGHIRLSYAAGLAEIEEAVRRMRLAIEEL
jgi:aspartate aminotransferase